MIQCLTPSAVTSLGSPAKLTKGLASGRSQPWTSEFTKVGTRREKSRRVFLLRAHAPRRMGGATASALVPRAEAEAIPIIVRTTAMGFAKRSTHLICARRANQFVGGLCLCPVPFEKIFLFFRTPNQSYMIRCPVPQRGDTRSSRPRGGMRWTRMRR